MTSAAFNVRDDATQGDWFNPSGPTFVYFRDGFQVTSASSLSGMFMPSYVSGFAILDSPSEAQFVAKTSERFGLLRYPGGDPDDRFFPLWFKSDFRIAFAVSQACRFATYNRDNDFGRVQTLEIQDGDTGSVLDSRTIEGFDGGAWLSWDLSPGNYVVHATSPTAAIICAVGWGPIPVGPSASIGRICSLDGSAGLVF